MLVEETIHDANDPRIVNYIRDKLSLNWSECEIVKGIRKEFDFSQANVYLRDSIYHTAVKMQHGA